MAGASRTKFFLEIIFFWPSCGPIHVLNICRQLYSTSSISKPITFTNLKHFISFNIHNVNHSEWPSIPFQFWQMCSLCINFPYASQLCQELHLDSKNKVVALWGTCRMLYVYVYQFCLIGGTLLSWDIHWKLLQQLFFLLRLRWILGNTLWIYCVTSMLCMQLHVFKSLYMYTVASIVCRLSGAWAGFSRCSGPLLDAATLPIFMCGA